MEGLTNGGLIHGVVSHVVVDGELTITRDLTRVMRRRQ